MSPDRALYLPTFSLFVIVNNTFLFLSLSLSLSLSSVSDSLSLALSVSLSLSLSPSYAGPVRPKAVFRVLLDRALCLYAFSQFLIVNKRLSLSRSRSLSLSHYLSLSLSLSFSLSRTRRQCWSPFAQGQGHPTGRCAYQPSVTLRLSIKCHSLSLLRARALSLYPPAPRPHALPLSRARSLYLSLSLHHNLLAT